MRLWARLTQVIRQVPQVWFDHSGMEVFVVSEELQVSGVVLKISLSDGSDIRSKKISVSWKVSVGEQPPLTLSFSEFSSSCLISFSLASLTACLVTERMASSTQTEHTFSFKTLSAQHHWQETNANTRLHWFDHALFLNDRGQTAPGGEHLPGTCTWSLQSLPSWTCTVSECCRSDLKNKHQSVERHGWIAGQLTALPPERASSTSDSRATSLWDMKDRAVPGLSALAVLQKKKKTAQNTFRARVRPLIAATQPSRADDPEERPE